MKYVAEDFDTLIRKSYGYDEKIQASSKEWQIVKALYENNYVKSTETIQRIPKKIHQIWLGGKLPDKYLDFALSWITNHPTWRYHLWTDEDINGIHMVNQHLFNRVTNLGMKSDILRYEILNQEGGIYIDTDFECLKPFDDLLNLEFFTGCAYDDIFVSYIGILASIPNHPIIETCIKNLNAPRAEYKRASQIMDVTGPYYFTRCFNKNVTEKTKGVVAFPMDYFYPWPNNRIKDKSDPYSFIKPCSYAVHHWAVSWMNSKFK